MVNKFWALFGEDGVSYATSSGESVNDIVSAPQDGQDWVEVNLDIHSGQFFKKEGDSIRPFTEEEFIEKTSTMLNNALLFNIRLERKKLLDESDWTQFDTSPLSSEKKEEWAVYRQALRDLPSTVSDPSQVVWPTKPE
jgi:hypothetical protein